MQAEATTAGNGAVRSMTGFGRGKWIEDEVEVVAEVRSVNHRFLDIYLRLPRVYSSLDPQIRKIVSERAHRGKLEVTVTRTGGSGRVMDVMVDHDLAQKYHKCLVELQGRLGLAGDISMSDMLTLKEIVPPVEKEEGIEKELPLVEKSLRRALDRLDGMRIAEGTTMWKDIEERLVSIEETVARISPLVDQVASAAKDRLEKRVKELTGGITLDEDRLLQEVALIADRSDVTEELIRLQSHVKQFRAFGKEGSPLGRKLDFLLQELHREVNTIGSKSASNDIASYVVLMKAETERIREQTQNLE